MSHPIYKVNGARVPSVTTILSRFKESGGLIHWSWQCGMDGKDYRKERDAAATIGTCAHAMVEAHIRELGFDASPYEPKTLAKAQNAFKAFLEWADNSKLKPIETELSLVSEKYKFGGTLDTMLIKGKLAVGDWKSSNAIYMEMLCQVAAYGKLWEENRSDQPIEGGYHIIRFDKTYGDFSHHWYPELDDAWTYFKLVREAYDLAKSLKKRAA